MRSLGSLSSCLACVTLQTECIRLHTRPKKSKAPTNHQEREAKVVASEHAARKTSTQHTQQTQLHSTQAPQPAAARSNEGTAAMCGMKQHRHHNHPQQRTAQTPQPSSAPTSTVCHVMPGVKAWPSARLKYPATVRLAHVCMLLTCCDSVLLFPHVSCTLCRLCLCPAYLFAYHLAASCDHKPFCSRPQRLQCVLETLSCFAALSEAFADLKARSQNAHPTRRPAQLRDDHSDHMWDAYVASASGESNHHPKAKAIGARKGSSAWASAEELAAASSRAFTAVRMKHSTRWHAPSATDNFAAMSPCPQQAKQQAPHLPSADHQAPQPAQVSHSGRPSRVQRPIPHTPISNHLDAYHKAAGAGPSSMLRSFSEQTRHMQLRSRAQQIVSISNSSDQYASSPETSSSAQDAAHARQARTKSTSNDSVPAISRDPRSLSSSRKARQTLPDTLRSAREANGTQKRQRPSLLAAMALHSGSIVPGVSARRSSAGVPVAGISSCEEKQGLDHPSATVTCAPSEEGGVVRVDLPLTGWLSLASEREERNQGQLTSSGQMGSAGIWHSRMPLCLAKAQHDVDRGDPEMECLAFLQHAAGPTLANIGNARFALEGFGHTKKPKRTPLKQFGRMSSASVCKRVIGQLEERGMHLAGSSDGAWGPEEGKGVVEVNQGLEPWDRAQACAHTAVGAVARGWQQAEHCASAGAHGEVRSRMEPGTSATCCDDAKLGALGRTHSPGCAVLGHANQTSTDHAVVGEQGTAGLKAVGLGRGCAEGQGAILARVHVRETAETTALQKSHEQCRAQAVLVDQPPTCSGSACCGDVAWERQLSVPSPQEVLETLSMEGGQEAASESPCMTSRANSVCCMHPSLLAVTCSRPLGMGGPGLPPSALPADTTSPSLCHGDNAGHETCRSARTCSQQQCVFPKAYCTLEDHARRATAAVASCGMNQSSPWPQTPVNCLPIPDSGDDAASPTLSPEHATQAVPSSAAGVCGAKCGMRHGCYRNGVTKITSPRCLPAAKRGVHGAASFSRPRVVLQDCTSNDESDDSLAAESDFSPAPTGCGVCSPPNNLANSRSNEAANPDAACVAQLHPDRRPATAANAAASTNGKGAVTSAAKPQDCVLSNLVPGSRAWASRCSLPRQGVQPRAQAMRGGGSLEFVASRGNAPQHGRRSLATTTQAPCMCEHRALADELAQAVPTLTASVPNTSKRLGVAAVLQERCNRTGEGSDGNVSGLRRSKRSHCKARASLLIIQTFARRANMGTCVEADQGTDSSDTSDCKNDAEVPGDQDWCANAGTATHGASACGKRVPADAAGDGEAESIEDVPVRPGTIVLTSAVLRDGDGSPSRKWLHFSILASFGVLMSVAMMECNMRVAACALASRATCSWTGDFLCLCSSWHHFVQLQSLLNRPSIEWACQLP
jgi:hypothetical protein